MMGIANELVVHGHPADGRALYLRALDWERNHPASDTTLGGRLGIGDAMVQADRLDDAGRLTDSLLRVAPDSVDVRALASELALARHDTAAARRIDDWLAHQTSPYPDFRPALHRAEIAAALGERERAVDLLRSAISLGLPPGSLHYDASLLPLTGYPPYETLARVQD
jgi:predicted Zn-dependent protease